MRCHMHLMGCIMQHGREQTLARSMVKFVYQPVHILPELSSGGFCLLNELFVCGLPRVKSEKELVYPGMKERFIFTRYTQQFTDDSHRQRIGKVIHYVKLGLLFVCIQYLSGNFLDPWTQPIDQLRAKVRHHLMTQPVMFGRVHSNKTRFCLFVFYPLISLAIVLP